METNLDATQKHAIIPNEKGIIRNYGSLFHLASPFAKAHLCYVLWAGEYLCSQEYQVKRKHLDSYSLFQVLKGGMDLMCDGTTFHLTEGTVIFLDFRKPHHYFCTDSPVQVRQFLINGELVQAYFEYLSTRSACLCQNNSRLSFLLWSLYQDVLLGRTSDHQLSVLIHNALTVMADSLIQRPTDIMEKARDYIQEHYMENITLTSAADHIGVSVSYLSRRFKSEFLQTPWEYVTHLRLRQAMTLLVQTDSTLELISEACGFNSVSHFIRAFKAETAMTPKRFRYFFRSVPMSGQEIGFDGL